ncbi:MAG: DUF6941 family protein [Acidimicrobiales bacterium]
MDVTLAVLADSAIQSNDGKLSIIGLFQEIRAMVFPAVHPQAVLVISLRASPAEAGEHKRLTIRLMDEDSVLADLDSQFDLPKPYPVPGHPAFINQIFMFQNLLLPRAGDYAFHILLGGEEKSVVSFSAVQIQPAEG